MDSRTFIRAFNNVKSTARQVAIKASCKTVRKNGLNVRTLASGQIHLPRRCAVRHAGALDISPILARLSGTVFKKENVLNRRHGYIRERREVG